MGEIYSEAKETIAWLGRNGSPVAKRVENSIPVTNLEQQLTLIAEPVDLKRAAVERFFSELPNWTTIIRYTSSGVPPSEKDLPRAPNEVLQLGHGVLWVQNSLEDVLSLPYWTRVWIIQEVARAKAVQLAFGSVSINFDDFILAYKSHLYHKLKNLAVEAGGTITGSNAAIEARAAVTEDSLSMRQVLKWSRICQASRPIDRIYGLFGLLNTHGTEKPSNLESLRVDYNRDITSVFWDVVFSCRILAVGDEMGGFFDTELSQFVESVPLLAKSLGCSQAFSPQALCSYSEAVQDTSLRRMAELTGRMVHVFQQIGGGIRAQPTKDWKVTREPARKTRPWVKVPYSNYMQEFELEIAAFFLEYANFDDVGESGEVHAACIASKLVQKARFSGEWTCKPIQDQADDNQMTFEDGKMRIMEYRIDRSPKLSSGSRRLLVGCSHHPNLATSPNNPGKHQGSDTSLFLRFSDPGLSLRLDLGSSGSTEARLSVTVPR